MLLHVFAHVETHQRDAQFRSQYLGHFRLSHSRRTDEQQAGVQQSRLGHLHGLHHLSDGFVLSVNLSGDAFVQCLQRSIVFLLEGLGINLAGARQHLHNQLLVDRLLAVGCRMDFPVGAGLVNQVDGLVGQEAVVDVA